MRSLVMSYCVGALIEGEGGVFDVVVAVMQGSVGAQQKEQLHATKPRVPTRPSLLVSTHSQVPACLPSQPLLLHHIYRRCRDAVTVVTDEQLRLFRHTPRPLELTTLPSSSCACSSSRASGSYSSPSAMLLCVLCFVERLHAGYESGVVCVLCVISAACFSCVDVAVVQHTQQQQLLVVVWLVCGSGCWLQRTLWLRVYERFGEVADAGGDLAWASEGETVAGVLLVGVE